MKRVCVGIVLLVLFAVASWGQATRYETVPIDGQFSDPDSSLCLCYHGTMHLAWMPAAGSQGGSLGGTFFADGRCTGAGCPYLLCPCGGLTPVAGNSLAYEVPFLALGDMSFQGMLTVTVRPPQAGQLPVVEKVTLSMR